jgi:hypothetical protein
VIALHAAVGLRQGEVLQGQAVVHHQRVLARRRLRAPRGGGIQHTALVGVALDEDGDHRGPHRPAQRAAGLVQEGPVGRRGGQQRHPLEAAQVHAQSPGILQEELGVGATRGDAAGLLLVEVLGQLPAHRRDRALHIGPADQHREVPNVDLVLLLQVDVQPVGGHIAAVEPRPGPVDLALHHLEQRLLKLLTIHPCLRRGEPPGRRNRAIAAARDPLSPRGSPRGRRPARSPRRARPGSGRWSRCW